MRKDVLTDVNGDDDLLIKDGDFDFGIADLQHVAHVVKVNQGHYKQFPLLGVGIKYYQNGFLDGLGKREIQLQLKVDGYDTKRIEYINSALNIEI